MCWHIAIDRHTGHCQNDEGNAVGEDVSPFARRNIGTHTANLASGRLLATHCYWMASGRRTRCDHTCASLVCQLPAFSHSLGQKQPSASYRQ